MAAVQQQRRSGLTRVLIVVLILVFVLGAVTGGIVALHSTAQPVFAAPASVIGWDPGITRGVPLGGPITVYFNRDMDHNSVEKAWKLTPRELGSFHWSGTAVSFRPAAPFDPGSYYRLKIGRSALDDQKRPLSRPFSIVFATGDAVKVTGETPADGATNVPSSSVISVTFNHPMVALTGVGAPAKDPAGWHVTISPHTPGYGTWLGTSTWVFHPRRGLVPSSRYAVTVSGDTHDAWGQRLSDKLTWSFATVRPAIVDEAPSSGSSSADPSAPVSVTFNQPMDVGSTVQAFSVRAGSGDVPGSTSWNGTTLQFQPATSLDPNRVYTATVGASALSANGNASLGRSLSWSFRVAPPPRVVSSTPSDGADAAQSYVEIHFSAPMNAGSLDRALSISPALANLSTYGSGKIYSISGDFQPSTEYSVSLSPGAEDRYGRTMQNGYTLRFTTAPILPSALLYGTAGAGPGLSFTAGRVANAPIQFINVPWINYTLVRTSLERVSNQYQFGTKLSIPAGTVIRSWKVQTPHPLNKVQNQQVPLANPDGSPLAPGLYWLGAQGPRESGPGSSGVVPASGEIVAVTNAGVTMKVAQNRVLVWVTSTGTGRPLPGETVRVADSSGKTIASGRTDAQGLDLFNLANPSNVQAATATGSAFGMALASWAPSPAASGRLSLGLQGYKASPTGKYVYTDRPIYRPGQTVHFRAVLWADHDGVYGALGATRAMVRAFDGSGRTVYQRSLAIDGLGTVHGSFSLPPRAGTGDGAIAVSSLHSQGEAAYANFAISAYRKPEFITSVSTARKQYAQGQSINAAVHVRYVFGAAAAGQQVDWTAYSQSDFNEPAGWDRYQFGDVSALQQWYAQQGPGLEYSGTFGTQVAHGSGTTDSAGLLAIHLPVDLSREPLNQIITVEATGTDINHQPVSGRVRVTALKAAEQIGLSPRKQVVAAGSTDTVDVVSVSADGKPLPNAALTATVYRRTYTSELGGGVGSLWRQVPHDVQVSSQSLNTNGTGITSFSFSPAEGGAYYVVVTGKDNLGNTARSGVFIYASAAGFSDWGTTADTSVALQPDRQSYQVGQTAKILVAAPFAATAALVTTERSGIRTYQVEKPASSSPTIRVPIRIDDVPNVYVTVTLYRGQHGPSPPQWRYGVTEIRVSAAPRTLVIHLTQDRPHYQPGQTAAYTVITTDASGRPVPAEVSLALVDTAVLALQADTTPSILNALYGERPLGVQTMSDGVASIDSLTQTARSTVHPSQLGGGGGGGGNAPSTVYKRFRDTGYWRANLMTNRNGRATVRVRLPDNFTTWRLDARGVTAGYRVGQARLLTLSTRDIVLRPVAPRFFLQGDTVRIGAVVNNDTSRPARLMLRLQAAGLHVPVSARHTTIPAHGERFVTWKATVLESSGATLTYSATPRSAAEPSYSVRIRVPVHPPLTEEVVAASGQVFGSMKQAVLVPAGARSKPGSLTVDISSSATAGLGRAYGAFTPSPYESNDDVAARLLAANALLGIPPVLRGDARLTGKRLRSDARSAARTLSRRQLPVGGWSWFTETGAPGDPLVSADVVLALASAGQSPALLRGSGYLRSRLPSMPADERAFLLSVLARSGHPAGRETEALNHDSVAMARLSASGIADLAVALAASGDLQAARSLMARLDSMAVVSATGANWEAPGLSAGTAVETTAHVLAAILRLAPNDPYVPAAARWLMLARTGSAWDTARDSALAVSALASYARSAHEGHASYRYRIAVNGATKLLGAATPGAPVSSHLQVPVADLHHGGSSFTVSRFLPGGSVGGGPLYYVAQLHYFLPATSMAPLDQGISVARRYLNLSGQPITAVAAGSTVQVELTLTSGRTLTHLAVNDPIPSGFEPIDQSLQTSKQGLFDAWELEALPPGVRNLSPYLRHTDLRDDRVSLDASSLPPGRYRYSYLAQATVSGSYAVAPVRAAEVFFPEVFGRSAGQGITIH